LKVFLLVVSGLTLVPAVAAQTSEVAALVARLGDYVSQYYARSQSVLVEETVLMQPLSSSWSTEGFPRRLFYEVHIEWDPSSVEGGVSVIRKLIRAEGPPLGSPDQPDCMDPRTVSPEPLAFLLPERRRKFRFDAAGAGRVEGQPATVIRFRALAPEPPEVDWRGDCARVELPGRTQGRIWADPLTSEVLRLDEHLIGLVDIPGRRDRRNYGPNWFTIERADTSIRYTRVAFENPDEVLTLPSRIDTLSVIRNSGVPRLRMVQTYTNYRRFVTDSRIIP
jgi:hypothetical protein